MVPSNPMPPGTPVGTEESPFLLDIERRLGADRDGAYRNEVVTTLEDLRLKTKQRLDAGVTPDDFQHFSAILRACDAALAVVRTADTGENRSGGRGGPGKRARR